MAMTTNGTAAGRIELDGAAGEGGGQVLRSALTLAMITGRAFRIERIRAGRARPGLLRQHLTAVEAAAAICGARVAGAQAGSQTLEFAPGRIRGGDYRFAIGTAGSCTLVLQTVLPALWFADAPSRVAVSGGTHNQAAPSADFLIRAWQPLLARMGVRQQLALRRHGFYPAGGGEIEAAVEPVAALQPLQLAGRGERGAVEVEALVAGVPGHVAARELAHIAAQLAAAGVEAHGSIVPLPAQHGPGNVVQVALAHTALTEVFTGYGEKGVSAERVADGCAREVLAYLNSPAAVGEHLADQLLLPLALAGGGGFTTTVLSSHLRTNAEVIARFLPVTVAMDEDGGCARVSLRRDGA